MKYNVFESTNIAELDGNYGNIVLLCSNEKRAENWG